MNDYSNSFDILRKTLEPIAGDLSYREFRRNLTPRFWLARIDLVATHALFVLSLYFAWWCGGRSILLSPFCAVLIGFCLHRLSLFLHEGAHFLLADSRTINDFLTNSLVGLFVLSDVRSYRIGHMQHHRHLGTLQDPERSYQTRLSAARIASSLFGINAAQILWRQRRLAQESRTEQKARSKYFVPLVGLVFYLFLVFIAWASSRLGFGLSVAIGVASVFPLVGTLRQTLEHRSSAEDFLSVEGLPSTRILEGKTLRFFLGAAGFDKHLLHHWDPGVSYTRLRELQDGIASTPTGGSILIARTFGYVATFRLLWKGPRG